MLQEENAINLICFLLLGFVFREGQDSLTVKTTQFSSLPPSFLPPRPSSRGRAD